MRNRKIFKCGLVLSIALSIVFIIGFIILERKEYEEFIRIDNAKIGAIIKLIEEKYSSVDKTDIVEILNSESIIENDFLREYGIDIEREALALEQSEHQRNFLRINAFYIGGACAVLVLVYIGYDFYKEKKVKEITKLLGEIQKQNYKLEIDGNTEDELSILKNELAKVTIMLQEHAENSLKDKLSLKSALEDISHQLKTPLTSIMISLENIIDNPEMAADKRREFLHSIKRETTNISFLVQSLLKLTKFETNTIAFSKTKVRVRELIDESIKNVSLLGEVKDVKVVVAKLENFEIECDKRWQIEAITNILKNAIEHSDSNEVVEIETSKNKVYSSIKIKNKGNIAKKDLPLLFKRFYRGENASVDSVGIGLALSKSIVEKDNGSIAVDTDEKGEIIFTIHYFN